MPRLTFFAALGAVIARGEHHHRVFDPFAPGLDIAQAERERALEGDRYRIERRDFYPDALPCLAALRESGLIVGIAGNQPEDAEEALRAAGAEADHVASSARWGVEKPSPHFFAKIIEQCGFAAGDIAYVGDRLDNDILPARAMGMMAIFIERGPWGVIHASQGDLRCADAHVRSLSEIPPLLSSRHSSVSGEVRED
ncbi:HAD family hydrolase [Sphingomonas sp. RT2P30]